jgi:hypothetical protein
MTAAKEVEATSESLPKTVICLDHKRCFYMSHLMQLNLNCLIIKNHSSLVTLNLYYKLLKATTLFRAKRRHQCTTCPFSRLQRKSTSLPSYCWSILWVDSSNLWWFVGEEKWIISSSLDFQGSTAWRVRQQSCFDNNPKHSWLNSTLSTKFPKPTSLTQGKATEMTILGMRSSH